MDGFLGAQPSGAFGDAEAVTAFAGVNGMYALGNWKLMAAAYVGRTRAKFNGGWLRNAGDIVSGSLAAGAARESMWLRGDWVGILASQPLRAERGKVGLRLPVGRDKYREVLYETRAIDLQPDGRDVQVETAWHFPFGGGRMKTGVTLRRHARNDASREMETNLRVSFEKRF